MPNLLFFIRVNKVHDRGETNIPKQVLTLLQLLMFCFYRLSHSKSITQQACLLYYNVVLTTDYHLGNRSSNLPPFFGLHKFLLQV